MLADGAAVVAGAFCEGLRPAEQLTVSQWADRYRVLSQEASSEPGQWRTDRTPYLREILDCLSIESPVQRVVFMKGAQIGGSEAGFNWLGYAIHQAPGPMMMVQPSIELAEKISKQRIAPMIRECPVLRERVRDTRSRDSGNTLLSKEFPGGMLMIAGANSAPGLRSAPIAKLMLDEVDAYPKDVDGEGSPIELAEARTRTFPRRKIFKVSTPTIKGESAIEAEFLASDQRYFHLPCPHCGTSQALKWANVKWEKDAKGKPVRDTVRYVCDDAACRKPIEEHRKPAMLAAGRWVAKNPGSEIAGFHLSALYSPLGWYSWADMAMAWHDAQKNPAKLKAFINTALGETFEIRGEDMPEWRDLYDRREERSLDVVPRRAVALTCAVDVQKDRLEAKLVGWNRKESWVVDKIVLMGDTSLPPGHGPWRALDDLLDRDHKHESGKTMRIRLTLIDSGYQTQRVYEYVASRPPATIRAIKGQDTLAMPIGSPSRVDLRSDGKRRKRGGKVWPVGTNHLKTDVMGRLKQRRPTEDELHRNGWPPTYVHLPPLDEEYFKQLTAEQLIRVKNKKGFEQLQWVKTYPNNEALDLLCYNVAAWYGAGMAKWADEDWIALEVEFDCKAAQPKATPPRPTPPKPAAPKPAPKQRPERKSSIW